MRIADSYELLEYLKSQNLLPVIPQDFVEISLADLESLKDLWWWPNALSFEVIVGAILVQNTRWEQVSSALEKLKNKEVLNLNSLSEMSLPTLQNLIQKCRIIPPKSSKNPATLSEYFKRFWRLCKFLCASFKAVAFESKGNWSRELRCDFVLWIRKRSNGCRQIHL